MSILTLRKDRREVRAECLDCNWTHYSIRKPGEMKEANSRLEARRHIRRTGHSVSLTYKQTLTVDD